MSRASPTPTHPSPEGAEAVSEGVPLGQWIDGRYRVVRLLGRGGLGLVYEAEHARLGRRVAIKVLKRELAEHESLRPRFEREARVLASLSHPNVVGVSDYGVWEKCPYLVMELLEGETLRTRVKTVRISEDQMVQLMTQLLQGLSYAHGRGIIHRDLKPANVFLQSFPTQPDHLKILDFGFAKFVGPDHPAVTQLSRAGVVLGTPAYMAPEQILADPTDARTDVYAAGIMLHEMLTGEQPFQGKIPDVLRRQLREGLPPLEQVRPELRPRSELSDLLQRATAKGRDDRFADALELLNAFHAVPRPLFTWDTRDVPSHEQPSLADAPTRVMVRPPRGSWLRMSDRMRAGVGVSGRWAARAGRMMDAWRRRGARRALVSLASARRRLRPLMQRSFVQLLLLVLWLWSVAQRARTHALWVDARLHGWASPKIRAWRQRLRVRRRAIVARMAAIARRQLERMSHRLGTWWVGAKRRARRIRDVSLKRRS